MNALKIISIIFVTLLLSAPVNADQKRNGSKAGIVATTSYNTHYKVFTNLIKISYIAADKPLNLVYSIRKDWPELISILNKALSAIDRETYDQLFYKWFNMETVRKVQTNNRISTAIVDDYFPYTFLNEKGEPDGFSVDLTKAIAKELGMNTDIRVEIWDNALKKLLNDEINLLPMMAYSQKRDAVFDFSSPHTVAYDAFFIRTTSPKINKMEDLKGKKIIIMKNDRAHDHLKQLPFISNEQFIFENSPAKALQKLSSGIGDTAVMPKILGLVLIKKYKLINIDTSPAANQDYKRFFCFAVKDGNSEFLERIQNGLQIIKETGEYQKIHDKWLGIYEPHEHPFSDVLEYFFWIMAAFAAGFFLLVFWNIMLKMQVSKKTKKLEQEIEERKSAQTELVHQQRILKAIIDNIPVLITLYDPRIQILLVNKAFEKTVGWSNNELQHIDVMEVCYPDPSYRAKALEYMQKASSEWREFKLNTKHGRSIDSIWSNVRLEDGTQIGIGIDITEKKRLETNLQQAVKMQSVGNLAGGIAHDFNNILSSIIGFTELALDSAEKGSLLEDNLQEVYRAGKRAKSLVKQILAFARQSDEEIKPVRIDTLVQEVLKLIRASIPATIDIRKSIDSPSLVMGNSVQVHQIIMNLCSNAAAAMDTGGGVLEVSLKDIRMGDNEYSLKPGDYVELKVSDTGVGIHPENINLIFDPYFTTKSPGEGSGMGLAVVYGIVERYGGKISVDSTPGSGSTFTVYLPITKTHGSGRFIESGSLPTGKERILFVDDEVPIVKMGARVLDALGYSVTTKTSSLDALALFRSEPHSFDLVITDMTMPGMSGDRFAVELMKIRPDIPVILCTGYSAKISEESAAKIGIKAFAYKPIIKADLANAVRKILDEEKGDATDIA